MSNILSRPTTANLDNLTDITTPVPFSSTLGLAKLLSGMIVSGRGVAPFSRSISIASFTSGNYAFPYPDDYQPAPYQLPMLEPKKWNISADILTGLQPVEIYRIGSPQYVNDQGLTVPADYMQQDFPIIIYPSTYTINDQPVAPLELNQSVLIRVYKNAGVGIDWARSNIKNNGQPDEAIRATTELSFIVTNILGEYRITRWITPDFMLTGLLGVPSESKSSLSAILKEYSDRIDEAAKFDDQFRVNELRQFTVNYNFNDPKYAVCDGSLVLSADYPDLVLNQKTAIDTYLSGLSSVKDFGVYNNKIIVLYTSGGVAKIFSSSNLIDWEEYSTPVSASSIYYTDGFYWMPYSNVIYKSSDLANWTVVAPGFSDTIVKIKKAGNILFGFLSGPNYFIYSENGGSSWTRKSLYNGGSVVLDVVESNGNHYFATPASVYTYNFSTQVFSQKSTGITGTADYVKMMKTIDGKPMVYYSDLGSFYVVDSGLLAFPMARTNSFCIWNGKYWAAGSHGASYFNLLYSSEDLINWTQEDSGVTNTEGSICVMDGFGDELVYGAIKSNIASISSITYVAARNTGYLQLPTITNSQYKTYIKLLR